MASVAQAYRTRAPVVDDRVNLVQGGTGYIMHYPVFLPNAELNTDQFWGVISIVMDREGLLQAPQHDFSDPEQYSFELHPLKASGLVEALPDHRLSTLKDKPVVTTFNVLGTRWEAAVRPPPDGRRTRHKAETWWVLPSFRPYSCWACCWLSAGWR